MISEGDLDFQEIPVLHGEEELVSLSHIHGCAFQTILRINPGLTLHSLVQLNLGNEN